VRVTTLAGAGLQRGLEQGQVHGGAIADTVTALKTHLAAAGHPPGPLGDRLATSALTTVAADLTPDLWAEVTAIAGGSRIPLADVLLLVFLDEVWGMTRAPGCSVAARTLPGRPGSPPSLPSSEIGQTMDLPEWAQGRSVALRVGSDHAPHALVLAYPGSIGLCGANEAGLGVAVNALTRAPTQVEGLGVAFVTRHLLTLTTLAAAEDFLTSVPHAAGQAYTVAAIDGIATFEADATGVRRVTRPGVATIAHTNHPLIGDAGGRGPSRSSAARLTTLAEGLDHHVPLAELLTGDVTVDGTKWGDPFLTFGAFRAIGSEPVVRFIDGVELRAGRREWSRFSYR
jgi:isopenicillin-N N-acyltransferase like protein